MENITLICIPYAGGSSIVYKEWAKYLDPSIRLALIELSGRGKRFAERLYTRFEEVVPDILEKVLHEIDSTTRYALFGHSMGSAIVYELYSELKRRAVPEPECVFVSGGIPPLCSKGRLKMHMLSPDAIRDFLIDLGGIPKKIYSNDNLFRFFLPVIQSDFEIIGNYVPAPEIKTFDCPLYALSGTRDRIISHDDSNRWREYAENKYESFQIDGGHFFIKENVEATTGILNFILNTDNRGQKN
jgi:medium-chain acyl-[acyl-carrier-protein] hydrolase